MKNNVDSPQQPGLVDATDENGDISVAKVKFEVYGEEMFDRYVKSSGNSGRIYVPPDWIGHRVKIIRIN